MKNSTPRTSMLKPMPVLDRYVLREFLKPLGLLMVAFVALFMIGDIYSDLSTFLGSKTATWKDLCCFFIWRIPGNVRFVLPISLLLACMYSMANFGKHSEITAMRASGISLIRAGGTIYCVAILFTFINFALNEGIVPDLDRAALEIKTRCAGGIMETGHMMVYQSEDNRRSWFFNTFYEANEIQSQVIIHKLDENQQIVTELRADSVLYDPNEGWTLNECVCYTNSPDYIVPRREQLKSVKLRRIDGVIETPRDIVLSSKPADDLPITVLLKRMENCPEDAPKLYAKYESIFYFRIAFPWACLIGVMLGIPLAGKNVRSGIMLSIVSAALLIVLYIVVAQIFNILGQRAMIPPVIAGLAPTIFFFFYAIYVMKRSD